jgi:hypothetical protein
VWRVPVAVDRLDLCFCVGDSSGVLFTVLTVTTSMPFSPVASDKFAYSYIVNVHSIIINQVGNLNAESAYNLDHIIARIGAGQILPTVSKISAS